MYVHIYNERINQIVIICCDCSVENLDVVCQSVAELNSKLLEIRRKARRAVKCGDVEEESLTDWTIPLSQCVLIHSIKVVELTYFITQSIY